MMEGEGIFEIREYIEDGDSDRVTKHEVVDITRELEFFEQLAKAHAKKQEEEKEKGSSSTTAQSTAATTNQFEQQNTTPFGVSELTSALH
jgi:hypothetical protein